MALNGLTRGPGAMSVNDPFRTWATYRVKREQRPAGPAVCEFHCVDLGQ